MTASRREDQTRDEARRWWTKLSRASATDATPSVQHCANLAQLIYDARQRRHIILLGPTTAGVSAALRLKAIPVQVAAPTDNVK